MKKKTKCIQLEAITLILNPVRLPKLKILKYPQNSKNSEGNRSGQRRAKGIIELIERGSNLVFVDNFEECSKRKTW